MFRKVTVSEEVKKRIEEREAEEMEKTIDKMVKESEEKRRLTESFDDTCKMSESHPVLIQSVKNSIAGQEIIPGSMNLTLMLTTSREGKVIVSRKETLEAAAAYKGKKIAVLNQTHAESKPGGFGNINELSQEERLLRESTLHSCLITDECMEQFYQYRGETDLYRMKTIYTPDVTVFKTSDKIPVFMQEPDWFDVDVISMAKPDFHYWPSIEDEQILDVFETRFSRMMMLAAAHNVEVLILGALGCGAFGTDPTIVATGAARALEKYHKEFDTVEFAIYDPGTKKNFRMFRMVLDRYLSDNQ